MLFLCTAGLGSISHFLQQHHTRVIWCCSCMAPQLCKLSQTTLDSNKTYVQNKETNIRKERFAAAGGHGRHTTCACADMHAAAEVTRCGQIALSLSSGVPSFTGS